MAGLKDGPVGLPRASRRVLRSDTGAKIESASLLDVLERAFVVVALILFSGAFLILLSQGPDEATADTSQGSSLATQAVYAGVYGVTFLLVLARLGRSIFLCVKDPLLLVVVGIAAISVLWSADPGLSLRSSMALIGTTLFGVYLGLRFNFRDQLRLLAWALGIAAVFSLMFALALPEYGITADFRGGEAWRGVYHQKNVLGRLMALGGVVFLLLAASGRGNSRPEWAGFGLSVSIVALANSATALVALMAVLGLLPLYKALRRHYTFVVPFLIGVVLLGGIAAVWVFDDSAAVLATFGRDTTFTGRTDIWSAVLDKIRERPWLGYGYGAFWQGWEGESADVWLRIPYDNLPEHAHNGFLDLWLDLGLLGLAAFAIRLVFVFAMAVLWVRSTKSAEGLWPLSYMTFLLLYSTTYPVGLEQNSIWWVLYVAVSLPLVVRAGRASGGLPGRTSSAGRLDRDA